MVDSVITKPLTNEELAELKVRCLTLPLHGMVLLLPNTVVAEVLDYREPEATANLPPWVLGMLSWRGRAVPLVAFEKLVGRETGMRSEETRLVVCNTVSGNTHIPFIAMQVEGIPHLAQVDNGMLAHDVDAGPDEPAVLAHLRLQGESVIVPNIDVMERMLERLGLTSS